MTQPGNTVATVVEDYGSGLEDLEGEIGAVPRIGINHQGGTFKDALSGEEFPKIIGVLLSVFKQRVFFPPVVEEKPSKPFCKSNDAKTGFPNMELEKNGGFPWSEAPGLDPNTQPKDEHNRTIIACETCPFAEWGRDAKTGKGVPPVCKERHTYPVIYNRTRTGEGYEPPYFESGIVSFQGSGIKPSKTYCASFSRAKLPLYSAITEIALETNKRGNVTYSVPKFMKVTAVPQDEWEMYARDIPDMRLFLTRPPRPDDDGSDPTKNNGQSAAQAAANAGIVANANVTVAPSQPVQAYVAPSAPASVVEPTPAQAAPPAEDADELPF